MKLAKLKSYKEYSKLLRMIKLKQKQFEQEPYEEFLFDQSHKLKKGEPFNISKCKKAIIKSNNPKIKEKVEDLIKIIKVLL